MNVRPLYDRVLLRRVDAEETTPGGIIIPENAKEKPIEGHVLAVGNGKVLDDGSVRPMQIREGDRVLFGKFAGVEVIVGGEKRLIVREDDIFGVLDE